MWMPLIIKSRWNKPRPVAIRLHSGMLSQSDRQINYWGKQPSLNHQPHPSAGLSVRCIMGEPAHSLPTIKESPKPILSVFSVIFSDFPARSFQYSEAEHISPPHLWGPGCERCISELLPGAECQRHPWGWSSSDPASLLAGRSPGAPRLSVLYHRSLWRSQLKNQMFTVKEGQQHYWHLYGSTKNLQHPWNH